MKKYRVRDRAHPELLEDLLLARGVEGSVDSAAFLTPDFERDSHDPHLLPDMTKAVERIRLAVANKEQVAVWSDYDCDGIPGGVLLTEFLRAIGLSVRHYIPHRHKEGYGLNQEGLEELAAQEITLVITVDLGTTEIENIAFANTKGMDVIVTDHHLVSGPLPEAFAIINPKRPDSAYPFDGLCGAGVAWKLVQGVLAKDRFGIAEGQEKWLLDLAALGTLSDMVPLVGENRMIAHFGLRVMRRNRRPGLSALLSVLRIKPQALSEDDIGFMIAPRINAASRMGSPESAAKLLRSSNVEEAKLFAKDLDAINDERKGVVASTVKEVNKRMVAGEIEDAPVIVMGSPNWRPGILGLVANSLAEAHHKPTFLWGREDGELLRGSCRSGNTVNLVELMAEAQRLSSEEGTPVFEHCGGHSASGGFALEEGRAHELSKYLTAAYVSLKNKGEEIQEVVIDRSLGLAEVRHAHKTLEQLAPFGVGNAKPLFLLENVSIYSLRTFGKTNNHLELQLEQNGTRFPGIAFFSTPESFQKTAETGVKANVVGHVETDWRGGPRIRVIDLL